MGSSVGAVVYLLVVVLEIAAMWMVFQKAGRPGWGAIVPFYNIYLLLKIAGRPGWWLVLYMIPFVDLAIYVVVMLDIAKSFGRGIGFAIGLILLSPIFIPILGFGDAQYRGSNGQAGLRPAAA